MEIKDKVLVKGPEQQRRVEIPQGVTEIGNRAFYKNTAVQEVILPAGVISIGVGAFEGCTELKAVSIPEGVTSIGKDAFFGCTKLKAVILPEGVTSIGERAFYNCPKLKTAVLPKSLEEIGANAFAYCKSLKRIEIPENVVRIGAVAFNHCYQLKTVVWNARACQTVGTHREVDVRDMDWTDDTSFYDCNRIEEIVIGDGVVSLPEYALSIGKSRYDMGSKRHRYSKPVARLIIGKGLTYCAACAFDGTTYIEKVYYTGDEESWKKIQFDGYAASPVGSHTTLYIGGKVYKKP